MPDFTVERITIEECPSSVFKTVFAVYARKITKYLKKLEDKKNA